MWEKFITKNAYAENAGEILGQQPNFIKKFYEQLYANRLHNQMTGTNS